MHQHAAPSPPELLGELQGLLHDALLAVVVAHLGEAGEREVLAQRVAREAIVCNNQNMLQDQRAKQRLHA